MQLTVTSRAVMRTVRIAFVACSLLASLPAAENPVGESRSYKRVGELSLNLYIVRPAGWQPADSRPAIVFFHGGGWTGGPVSQFNPHSTYFGSRGLVCIQVEYRLVNAGDRSPPTVCIHDARSAIRWVRSHAGELGVDPKRIAAAGGSAGGHLAAHAGLVDALDDPQDDPSIPVKPNALILFNPVLDNGPGEYGAKVMGERYAEYSPAHNVSRDDPPTILFLGTEDKLVPVATLERFKTNMDKAGVRCELRLYAGEGHGFFNHRGADGGKYFALTVREADKFLASLGWLKGEPTLTIPVGTSH